MKPLVVSSIQCLGDSDLHVVKMANLGLTSMCNSSIGAAAIFSNEGMAIIQEVMIISASTRFNVYEVIIKILIN